MTAAGEEQCAAAASVETHTDAGLEAEAAAEGPAEKKMRVEGREGKAAQTVITQLRLKSTRWTLLFGTRRYSIR